MMKLLSSLIGNIMNQLFTCIAHKLTENITRQCQQNMKRNYHIIYRHKYVQQYQQHKENRFQA